MSKPSLPTPKEQGRDAYWSGCDDPEAMCPFDTDEYPSAWVEWFEGYADAKKLAEA